MTKGHSREFYKSLLWRKHLTGMTLDSMRLNKAESVSMDKINDKSFLTINLYQTKKLFTNPLINIEYQEILNSKYFDTLFENRLTGPVIQITK